MAVLLDLSNELIILIASHMSKPSHLLHFALTNTRIYALATQRLYENVTFHHDEFSSYLDLVGPCGDKEDEPSTATLECMSSFVQNDYGAPHSNLLRLSDMIRSNALPAGQTVTRLSIVVGINREGNQFQTILSSLLPQLHSLKHLTLKSVSETRLDWQRECFSLESLSVALDAASQTLQSLDMDFALDPEDDNDGWTIGSLSHFSKLRHLSVQGCVLLGQSGTPVSTMPSLDSVLPPGLKCLHLRWDRIEELQNLVIILEEFVDDSVTLSRKMEKLIVQLHDGAGNPSEQSLVQLFERTFPIMNERARTGGLELELALDWRREYPWVQQVNPYPEDTLFDRLREVIEEYTGSPS